MRKGLLLLFVLLLSLPSALFAGPRSFQQALKIAERQAALLGITMDESAVSQAKSFGGKTSASSASVSFSAYYVFPNGEDKGFTIVSGDDRLPEIVGYSDHGTFDSENVSANYVSFMKAYQEMVEAMEKGDSQVLSTVAEAKALRTSSYQQPKVEPFMDAIKWGQGTPYNNMCPIYDGTNRAVTGCVATAMAQVMMYYQYPKELKADIPSYTTATHKLVIPQINKGEKYEWNKMLPAYYVNQYTDEQAAAVAKLLYHCGAAVKMNYSSSSGANVTPTRLAQYFGYDADMMLDLTRSTFTLEEWKSILDKELVAQRPVLYSGQSSSGGHEFICDGADGHGLYHINWGWQGSQNGYFDITILNPKKGGIGSGNAPDGYNRECSMIVGIAPDNGKVDEPVVDLPQIVLVNHPKYTSFEIVSATRTDATGKFQIKMTDYFVNQKHTDFSGYLAYGVKSADGTFKPLGSSKAITISGVEETGVTHGTLPTYTLNYAFPVGKTTIYGIYSTDGRTWHSCAYSNMKPVVVEATATTLTKVHEKLSVSLKAKEELLADMDNTFELTISNPSDFEYLGLLNIYSGTSASAREQSEGGIYVTVPAHGTITKEIQVKPSAGDLYLWVDDEDKNTLVDAQKFVVVTASEPILSVVKVWSNVTPDAYETEKAYYANCYVKAPRVDAEEAIFNYSIKNAGGTTTIKYAIVGVNGETMSYSPSYETARIPGNGAVTTLSRSFNPSNVGSHTIVSNLYVLDKEESGYMNMATSLPNSKLYIVNSGGWFNLSPLRLPVYVTGVPSGISSVSASSSKSFVCGGKGEIVILSDVAKRLTVYNMNGQKVTEVSAEAGVPQNIPVASGIYVVDGKKILVK